MNHHFVKTLGEPYFAFMAFNVCDYNTMPPEGAVRMQARVRIDELPPALASADELHPIMALVHDLPTQPTIMEIGVTPSGRFKANNRWAEVYQTPAGFISDRTRWYELSFLYDYLNTQWSVTIDGGVDTAVLGTALPLLPVTGYNVNLILFNGKTAISRTKVSCSSAVLTLGDTNDSLYTYGMSEGEGSVITPVRSRQTPGPAFPPLLGDGILRSQFYDPLITNPYGTVPTGSASGAYRWGLETDYTRQARPTTAYTRISE